MFLDLLDPDPSVRGSVADPGRLSRIPDPDFYPSRISDPGSRGQKGTGSQIRIRNTVRGMDPAPDPDLDPSIIKQKK
jgi:hypothetical protein